MNDVYIDMSSDTTGPELIAAKKFGATGHGGPSNSRQTAAFRKVAVANRKNSEPYALRNAERFQARHLSPKGGGSVQSWRRVIRKGMTPGAKRTTPTASLTVTSLDRSVEALSSLTSAPAQFAQGELRARAARLLRRASVDQSRLSPRVAGIALLLSDALLNTPEPDPSAKKIQALRLGLDSLMDSFVSQQRERELVQTLLNAGWEITAPFDRDEFADLVSRIST